MQKGTHDGHSHHSTKTDNHNPSHEKIEVIDQQQVMWCHEQQASFWTPKGSEINEHPNRMSKNEAKVSISEDEKKAVIIIQTQMEYWSTDVATNHQVTNQQPNDYKEPIKKSQDKVRGYNNKDN